jgi:rod shape determining protein RodA
MTDMRQSRSDADSIIARLARLPWLLLTTLTLVAAFGTAALYSVSGGSFEPWAQRHAIRFAVALPVAIILALVPLRIVGALAWPAYALALGLLVAVPLVGVEALGARRWLQIGGLSLQPVEIMKVALVLALAHLFARSGERGASRPDVVVLAAVLITVPAVLVIRQPDLGSGLLLAGVGLAVMFLAGVSLWYFAAGMAAVAVALPIAATMLHDYQRRRIEVFLDPDRDPLGAGYHIAQARIALGSGGWSGQGFGQGAQTQLDFVPEKTTDFIFVAIGEEMGFLGGATLLGLYAVAVALTAVLAIRARDPFARLVIGGTGAMLAIYVVINIGMVTGLVPVVGVPLPLVSYGGTAMMTLMVAYGLAMAAATDRGRR